MSAVPRRDRVAWWLACQALKLATPSYRNFVDGSIRYGMAAAARDVVQGVSMTCRRPECGQPWERHHASHGPPPPGAVEGDFGGLGWKGLYCPDR